MNIWILIIGIVLIIICGCIHLHNEIHQNKFDIAYIRLFVQQVDSFSKKIESMENYDKEWHFIVSKSIEASEKFMEGCPGPIYNLVLAGEQNNFAGIEQPIRSIAYNAVKAEEYYQTQIYNLKKQWRNPIILFYRGIQQILKWTLGYLIQIIYPSFSYESGFWKVFSGISSACSIAGFVIAIIDALNN